MKTLVIGCGYVGSALALELAQKGHDVTGIRRTGGVTPELRNSRVRVVSLDVTNPTDVNKLGSTYDWVVNSVAPSAGGAELYRQVYFEGMRHLLRHFETTPPRTFVYTGSSAVYAQDDGSEVTERSPAEPETDTGKILRETEEELLRSSREGQIPGIVLRASGIYGPGRTYWLKSLLSGEAATTASDRFMNMIHRDDLVGAIIAALQNGRPGEIYNASDNEPVRQKDLFEWLSTRMGRPKPHGTTGAPGSIEPRRRAATNKRISNRKLREELGYIFKWPTFREGYEAELQRLSRAEGNL